MGQINSPMILEDYDIHMIGEDKNDDSRNEKQRLIMILMNYDG